MALLDPNQFIDWSTMFNLAMVCVSTLGGWLLKTLFTRLRDLEQADMHLVKAINELRVDLPTHYVSKSDFKELGDNIFQALRRIEDKLDDKADKP